MAGAKRKSAEKSAELAVFCAEASESLPETPAKAAGKKPRLTRKQAELIGKALAEPRRVMILEQIAASSCPTACQAVFHEQNVSAATLSHHLKELTTAGLIRSDRNGKFMNLSFEQGVLAAYLERLSRLLPEG